MRYKNTVRGIFKDRPNRFIAHVEIDGEIETVHVKNTGRCRELLVPGVEVILEKSDDPSRKTKYDLICVNKEGRLINMDSQAPNKAAEEWVAAGKFFTEKVTVQREKNYGNSRFDLYVESSARRAFIEVKGVTLEEKNIVRFPDAPTIRGVKHLEELIKAASDGYEAYLLLVIQMKDVKYFAPNWGTHPEFGDTLRRAAKAGVHILAYDCAVKEDTMEICDPVPVDLDRPEVSALLKWYDANKRSLPWRDQNNAYYTWVSEIMLQQTRVEAVKPYFQRFIQELPDVAALAAAPEDHLVKLWEGLGYYSRVRNMQKAAISVMEDYGGRIPEDFETLLSLKGIGRYTAGAISSIAYGKCVPAVDGNVLRVYARLTENREDIMKQSVRKSVEDSLKEIMPLDRPGDFNQALMELGAVVCVPNGKAKCEECPLKEFCLARKHGTVEELPVKAPKKARKIENRTVLVIQDGAATAIRRRPPEGLLAGLYEIPNVEGYLTRKAALKLVEDMGLEPLRIEKLPDAKHIFSHIEWRMHAYRIAVSSLEKAEHADFLFADKKETDRKYTIPSAFSAYTKYMKEENP